MTTPEQLATPLSFAVPILPTADPTTEVNVERSPSEPGISVGRAPPPSASVRLTGVMIQTQELLKRALEEVAKPSVASFMETCDNNPKLAAVIAAPALLGLALVLLFFTISVVVLSVWTFSTILVGVLVVVVGGLLSLLLKLILVTAAALPLAAIATGFFVATITLFRFIISPATTLVWVVSSTANAVTAATTTEEQTSETETEAPQRPESAPSSHDSGYSNLVTAANVAWDTTVILGLFLKWTSQQLWSVGGRAIVEIKNQVEARQAQAQAQTQSTSSTIVPTEEGQAQANVSVIPTASVNTDNVTLTQRPIHTRARDDVDEE